MKQPLKMADPVIADQVKVIRMNIQALRREKYYAQEYLANKLGISQNAYSKLEKGETMLSLERVYLIAMILEVNVEQLLQPKPFLTYTLSTAS